MSKKEYIINSDAYTFEFIKKSTGLFRKDTLNATDIIHLEGNGRLNHIKEQINKFKTSETIFILHNKGYKNAIKQEYINKSNLDLVDAFLTIFKHAHNHNYKSVLIFEDDYICDNKLLDTNITNKICDFIDKHNEYPIIYHLGTLPYAIEDTYNEHIICLYSTGTHSVIYSRKFIDMALNCDQKEIKDWDLFVNKLQKINNFDRYMYKQCLCYQTFPSTENQQTCINMHIDDEIIAGLLNTFFLTIVKSINKTIKLDEDKNIDEKYQLFYDLCLKIPNFLCK